MFRKFLKWTGIVLGCLIGLLLVFYIIVYFSTQNRISKVYDVTAQKLFIPSDSASFMRGKHIAENRGCLGCHGDNLAGKEIFLPKGSPVGFLAATNITRGKGGKQYADSDWLRLLRHGINQEGKSAWFMPSQDIYHISSQEMADLICFVKQQPAVDNQMPEKEIKPLGRLLVFFDQLPLLPAEMIDHNAVYKDVVTPSVTPAYGLYLAITCSGCHGKNYKGGPAHNEGEPDIPNITSSGELGKWKESDFITALRTGKKPDGKQLSDAMPYKTFTYTDDELKAIYAFLKQAK